MNPRTFGIGVVGTGIMGQRMTAALAHHPRFSVAALWDPDTAALQAASSIAAGARHATDLADLISDSACDLVYVAAPPAAHRPIVQAVLAAGRACLCEKPLAADRAEADEVVRLVAESGLPFAVNFPLARAVASCQLAALLQSGALGAIETATIELRFARWPRQWQAGATDWLNGSVEGGFSREVLSHFVFLAERLFGPAEATVSRLTREPGRAETALQARLQHANVTVLIDAAVAGDVADHNRFEIVGSRSTAALTSWTRLEYRGQISDRVDPTPGTLDGVAALLDGQRDHGLATAEQAASVVRCIEAMLN